MKSLMCAVLLVLGCGEAERARLRDAGPGNTRPGPVARAPDAGPPVDAGPPQRIFTKKFVVNVRSAPNRDAPRIGYLRAGAVLQATTAAPLHREGCRGGWYELTTGGFVCNGYDVLAFTGRRLPERPPSQPDRRALLPYQYGINRRDGTPMYRRLPTDEEAAQYEGYRIPGSEPPADPTGTDSASVTDSATATATDSATATATATDTDSDTATATDSVTVPGTGVPFDAGPPTLGTLLGDPESVLMRRLVKGFYVSLDSDRRVRGRRYWRTHSNGFVPYGRLSFARPTEFRGIDIPAQPATPQPAPATPVDAGMQWRLPIGYVVIGLGRTRWFTKNDNGTLRRGDEARYHEAFVIAGEETINDVRYLVAHDGRLVRAANCNEVRARPRPRGVGETEKWIDIDLAQQSLVAYEGDRPVYVTLISSGRVDLQDDPNLSFLTPTGNFRISSKHLATTMDGDHAVDGPYSIEDVPYVMYFQLAYALHSAFWHNRFGHVRSHGCVNLAPYDARWIFEWSEPRLPEGWHGVYPTEQVPGTRIYIHGSPPGARDDD